jgi:hypothetical protein
MDMQLGDMDMKHGHAAWTYTCSIGVDIQLGPEHAALTWTCSTDMICGMETRIFSKDIDMQHGYIYAAWTWTFSTDMDMQHKHEHASRT